jgi:hypothetical protein
MTVSSFVGPGNGTPVFWKSSHVGTLGFNAEKNFRGEPVYWLVMCVSLTQAGVITEKRASGEEMSP